VDLRISYKSVQPPTCDIAWVKDPGFGGLFRFRLLQNSLTVAELALTTHEAKALRQALAEFLSNAPGKK